MKSAKQMGAEMLELWWWSKWRTLHIWEAKGDTDMVNLAGIFYAFDMIVGWKNTTAFAISLNFKNNQCQF